MNQVLAKYFSVDRRYNRSINLERDIDQSEALQGYILTERSHHALQRILIDPISSHRTNAYTITSIYGTGKSAFAHFLVVLNRNGQARSKALK